MTTERDVYSIDTSEAVDGLKRVDAEMKKLWDSSGQTKEAVEELAESFQRDLQQSIFSATAAYDMMKNAVREVITFVVDGTKAFTEAEQAAGKLQRALGNVGVNSSALVAQFQAQASALERLTGVDDDYIIGLQAMTVAMGVAPEMVGRLTKAALDMSAATGMDAKNALQAMARASASGSEDLKRYGVHVSEAEADSRGFVAILEKVEQQYGNISEAQPELIKTTNELTGAWNDFQEAVGELALKFVRVGEGGDAVVTVLDRITAAIKSANIEADGPLLSVLKSISPAIAAVSGAREALGWLGGKLQDESGPVSGGSDFSPPPAVHLPGYGPGEEKERKKARAKAEAEYKRHKEEMEKINLSSAANLSRLDKEADATMLKRVESQGDVFELAENERVRAAHQASEDYIAVLKDEEERRKQIADERLNAEKQFWAELEQTAKASLQGMLSQQFAFLGEMLSSNTVYNAQMFELELRRRTAGMEEAKVQEERAAMEKELADEKGAAYVKMTSDALLNIAQQASVKAVMEGVEAIAALASGNIPGAALHGKAAAGYAGVAILAGGAGGALASARGMTTAERQSVEQEKENQAKEFEARRKKREKEQKEERTTRAETETVVNVYNLGITGQTTVEQGKELDRIRSKYAATRTGGA